MNTANTAFLILSSILVLFMTPGLAFFYGGLVSARNVINTMLSVFIICGLAILLWIGVGYSLSFVGNTGGVFGSLRAVFLHGVDLTKLTATKIPTGLYLLFQMMFAIITPALFVGAVVGRLRFKFLLFFIVGWSILVYYPLVHMVWDHGLLAQMGVLDFAGGTVVHINAGITALMLSIFLGPRLTKHQQVHYNVPWVLLGTTILWIGWYGFNAGSALAVNGVAVQATLTTTIATAAAMMTWFGLEVWHSGKATLSGCCTGTLCGLVGITPAAGYVTVIGSLLIGVIATMTSFGFVTFLKPKLKIDDALDAFGCHGVAGIVGSILTGLFATHAVNPAVTSNGLLYGGGWHLLGLQLLATGMTILYTAILVSGLIWGLRRLMKMRVDQDEERVGLDQGEHGEVADYTVPINQQLTNELRSIDEHRDEFQGQLSRFRNQRPHHF